jgi:hypothetical protein
MPMEGTAVYLPNDQRRHAPSFAGSPVSGPPERERIAENVRALSHALELRKLELTIQWPPHELGDR